MGRNVTGKKGLEQSVFHNLQSKMTWWERCCSSVGGLEERCVTIASSLSPFQLLCFRISDQNLSESLQTLLLLKVGVTDQKCLTKAGAFLLQEENFSNANVEMNLST